MRPLGHRVHDVPVKPESGWYQPPAHGSQPAVPREYEPAGQLDAMMAVLARMVKALIATEAGCYSCARLHLCTCAPFSIWMIGERSIVATHSGVV